jgi:ERF superfamily
VTVSEAFGSALVAALAELATVATKQTADAGSYSYNYADLAGVVEATRPTLARFGLVALTPIREHGDGLECSVMLVHVTGEILELGPFPFPRGRDAQATGSMVTYHRRYALLAALGMGTAKGEDDDGAAAIPAVQVDWRDRLVEACEREGIPVEAVLREARVNRTLEELTPGSRPRLLAAFQALITRSDGVSQTPDGRDPGGGDDPGLARPVGVNPPEDTRIDG